MPDDFPEFGSFGQPQGGNGAVQEDDEKTFEKKLDHNRKLRDFREETWFFWIRITALIAVSVIVFALVCIYLWHIVGVDSMKWISSENLSKLQSFSHTVVTGVIASLSISYFFKK